MGAPLRDFPDELLRPLAGKIVHVGTNRSEPDAGTWAIQIPLEPFSADDQYATDWRAGVKGPEIITTSFVLESIGLPGNDLKDISGRTFRFPRNPQDGYIDGSIYLGAAHNPVDVTELTFGEHVDNALHARIVCELVFEFELTEIKNRSAILETQLHYGDFT